MGGVTGVPTKFVAGTNVTAPVEVFTVYVPSVVVRIVAVQSGADCPAEHSRTLVAWMVAVPVEVYPTSPVVVPPESFAVGVKVTDCPKSALPVSFLAYSAMSASAILKPSSPGFKFPDVGAAPAVVVR